MTSTTRPQRRHLSHGLFAVVVLTYLAIIQGAGFLIERTADLGDDSLTTTRGVLLGMWVPLGLALIFT